MTRIAAFVADRTWPQSFDRSPPVQEQAPEQQEVESLSTVAEEGDSEANDADSIVYEFLEPCENAQADRATVIKRTLAEKLGKAEMKAILSHVKETVLSPGGGKHRLLLYGGHALQRKR